MRIGIIGCGYVGQAAAQEWKREGHTVSVTTRHIERAQELSQVADNVFVLQDKSLDLFLQELDIVLISVAPDDLQSDYEATYLKTAQTVVSCLAKCPSLKQIIYISSTSVYGEQDGKQVDETTSALPINPQTGILNKTEIVLLEQNSLSRKVCIFRLGEIYGPGREIQNRLRQMQHKPFPGTGEVYANLIHLEDIVKALNFAVQRQLEGIYNLCNDDHLTRKELYSQLCQKFNLAPIQWDPNLQSRHSGNRLISNEKIKRLGFSFSQSITND